MRVGTRTLEAVELSQGIAQRVGFNRRRSFRDFAKPNWTKRFVIINLRSERLSESSVPPIADLAALGRDVDRLLTQLLCVDRPRFLQRLRSIDSARAAGRPFDRNLTRLHSELLDASERYQARERLRPQIDYATDLPIYEFRERILTAVRESPAVVICGETGSGKSTQLPKLCLEAGRGIAGMIGHTQPRRIAARTIASRLAEELRVPLGKQVGYKVRFEDSTGADTLVKLMTDGILLAETQGDRELRRYDTIIVDEAHERSLNIDFLLGYLKRLLSQRDDLRVIITSATIDAERFSEHFGNAAGPAPILQVSGRTYPVEIRYRSRIADELDTDDEASLDDESSSPTSSNLARTRTNTNPRPAGGSGSGAASRGDTERDLYHAISAAVEELTREGPGDALIFLPTERDIHESAKLLRSQFRDCEILPLYARLSVQEQQRVFRPAGRRRLVLATNVAESSLTVPGIRFVVDPGSARISRYSPRSKLQRLPIEPISQASANQRAGRCGRLGPGICIRLFSEVDYASREAFTVPEIRRTNLAAVILQTAALQLGDIDQFPFLDPPRPEAVRDGYRTLAELGAIDEEQRLTPLGRQLSQMPTDPRVGRIIVAGHAEQCLAEILIIAAGLEVQDVRDRPFEHQAAADEAHRRFRDEQSDFLSLLKVWDFYHQLKAELSRGQLEKACRQNFLSLRRIREWMDVHRELVSLAERLGWKPGPRHGDAAAIHRALLTGYLSNVAMKTDSGDYLVASGQKAFLWPGSGLAAKPPKWLLAAEAIETSRRFLRVVAVIDPGWVERIGGGLLKTTCSDAFWDGEANAAMAWQKVSLGPLVIVPKRRVRFNRIDSARARELLIEQGLVGQQFQNPPEFLEGNWQLAAELEAELARTRTGIELHGDEQRIAFYEQRLPPEIDDGQRLLQYARKPEAARLRMTRGDLVASEPARLDPLLFPETLSLHGAQLKLEYCLDPGSDRDGITVTIPQAAINQLSADRLGWLVPGLLGQKVESLLRTLPKDVRRQLAPIPETAAEVTAKLRFGEGRLLDALVAEISSRLHYTIRVADFQEPEIPPHLRMILRVQATDGRILLEGRDLVRLQRELGAAASESFSQHADPRWQRRDLVRWNFGDVPEVLPVFRDGLELLAYPGLRDEGTSARLWLTDSAATAAHHHRLGVRRLFVLTAGRELSQSIERLPNFKTWLLQAKLLPQPCDLKDQLIDLLADRAFLKPPVPRREAEFHARLQAGRELLAPAARELAQWLGLWLPLVSELRARIATATQPIWAATRSDIQWQAGRLLMPGFLSTTPWAWLIHYPRYLQGMVDRLQKLTADRSRDTEIMSLLARCWQQYSQRLAEHTQRDLFDPELETYRWWLEELRVATWAQPLGTSVTVSPQRLEKQWAKVSR